MPERVDALKAARKGTDIRWVSVTTTTGSTGSDRPGEGDLDALVRAHLPLVGYVVSELASRLPSHVHRDDLVSAGMAGLAEAAAAFDPANGVPFHRYAAIRIKGAMLDELRSNDWASRGARSRGRELAQAQEALAHELGREPAPAELAGRLGVSLDELERRRVESTRALLSLDAMETAVGDSIPEDSPGPAQQVVQAEQTGYLRAAVAALPERSRVVISGLFLEQRSIADIAAQLGVTESRVSQLKTEALGLLHDAMLVTHGDDAGVPRQRDASGEAVPGGPVVGAAATAAGTGVAARRRQQYYADVAANAAAAGLGAQAAMARAQLRSAAAGSTRSEQPESLRTHGSVPMRTAAGHGRPA